MTKNNDRNREQDFIMKENQTNIKWLILEVKDIKDNHLSAIYKTLTEIKEDLTKRPTWLITGVVSVCIGLIVYLLTKGG